MRHTGNDNQAPKPDLRGGLETSPAERRELQAVFCELARNAPRLTSHRALSGWLYTRARFLGARLQRAEARRLTRERASSAMTQVLKEPAADSLWKDIRPVLDEAMQALNERGRTGILLRFFKNQPWPEVGAGLGLTENAARMRVERALEKLRVLLTKRGVTSATSVLGATLMANAVSPAPVGLASTVAGPAIASTVGGLIIPGLSFNLLSMLNSTKITAGVSALALASLVGTYVAMNSENVRLRSEITALRSRPAQAVMQVLASATESQVEAGELARLRTEHSELMRLRGEVGQLRRELAQLAAEQVERDHLSVQRKAEADLVSAKRKFLIPWAQAFGEFARENMGRMPATIEEAAKYIPRSVQAVAESFPIEDFEIVFQGSLQALTDPWDIIILREKRPFQFNPGSHALRTYLFAHGHCEVRIAADGNFEPWEHQHLASTLPLSSSASE